MPLPDKSSPLQAASPNIPALIQQLAHSDSSTRTHAAAEIFSIGVARAEPIARTWLALPDLAACFVLEGSRLPQTTIGIATLPDTFTQIRAANGSPALADVPADLDAEEFELRINAARLDVLTTRDPEGDGAIAKFLKKRGEEIQQIEWTVRDVDRATAILREGFGIAPIYPRARVGADQARVNFFLVPAKDDSKLLIELVEVSPA